MTLLHQSGSTDFPKGRRPPECPGACCCMAVCGWAVIQGYIAAVPETTACAVCGAPPDASACSHPCCGISLDGARVERDRYREALHQIAEDRPLDLTAQEIAERALDA